MKEIVFPNGNEKEFISVAERLGFKELCFVYDYSNEFKKQKEKLDLLQNGTKINLSIGLLASVKNVQKAKSICSFIIMKATGNDQHLFERLKPSLIFDLELNPRKDSFHYRYSGLNQVLCAVAYRNNVAVGFSFSSLLNMRGMLRARILGRMIQNVKLCKKYKVKVLLASFASKPLEIRGEKDLGSLLKIIQ